MFLSKDDELLRATGLTSLEAVRSYVPTDLVKDHGSGRRDILRVPVPTSAGGPSVLFLKRVWRAAKKDGLKSLARYGQMRSVCLQEWMNYGALAAAGIATPGLVAVGQEGTALWERFSFILTVPAPGVPADEFLRATRPGAAGRRVVLAAMAKFVRRLHEAGLFSPDLFTRHVFVDVSAPGAPTFTLIDMARLDRASLRSNRLRARDLAALNITAPLSLVTRAERLRFLRDYDPAGVLLLGRIRRRVNYLLRRPKYAAFFG